MRDVQDVITSAIGGMNVTETVEGLARYPVNVRYPRELRNDLEALRQVAVHTPMGHTVPLGQVADIAVSKGPPAIKSEDARPTAWIFVDLSTSDIGGYVRRAQEAVQTQVILPPGMTPPVWSGQYEYMQRADERLRTVVPITIALIFVLLYVHFRRLGTSTLVLVSTLLFAPLGGVWLMWAFGYNLSVATGVGFIALAGLATEMVVVMVAFLDDALARAGELRRADLPRIIAAGAIERVRPLTMTVATTFVGLLPVMLGTEAGARVMKRLAAPMVGGLISSMALTLPALYLLWKRWALRGARP